MPYIVDDTRRSLEYPESYPWNSGELAYVLTQEVLRFLGPTPNFKNYAEVLGALEATKLELYRRAVAPYEDMKLAENGDLEWPTPKA